MKPKPERIRLSLETTPEFKRDLVAHGEELGERTLIGCVRESVRRSRELMELEKDVGG